MDRTSTLTAEPCHDEAIDAEDEIVEEVLLEEISIDGMCGVY